MHARPMTDSWIHTHAQHSMWNTNDSDVVGRTGLEPVTPCVSCKCATRLRQRPIGKHVSSTRTPARSVRPQYWEIPREQVAKPMSCHRGGERNRTAVQGFAGPCLSHSATPPKR